MLKEIADQMSLQEQVNYIGCMLLNQGKQALRKATILPACTYGNCDGEHCAIGWLLDETNAEIMDYSGPIESLVKSEHVELLPKTLVSEIKLFNDLHQFHDARSPGVARQVLENMRQRHSQIIFNKEWDELCTPSSKFFNSFQGK